MPILPNATNTLSVAASAGASDELIVLIAPCATSADYTVRRFGNASQLYDQHGYCEAVEFASFFKRPVLMAGIPIVTQGAIGRQDTSGNTDTCVTTVVAGGSGVLAEHDGILSVTTGGTIGTDQIMLSLSMDGGTSSKPVRLGTASSYVIPYVGVTINFAAGDLTAGDTIHTWHGSGPRGNAAGWTAAFTALKQQTADNRSILMFGDAQTDTEVLALYTELDAYASTNKRFRYARWGVYDRLPLATMSSTTHRMSSASITFAEVGATGDTISRAAGSFAADGFATGDLLTITGSSSNNKSTVAKMTLTSATLITLDTDDLVDEGPVSTVTIVGQASLTFAASGDTITRAGGSCGSWLDDGFRVGDSVTITGTASNNVTSTISTLTDTVMTLGNVISDEVIGITVPTITTGQTKAAWKAAVEAEFAPVTDKPLIDLSAGKGRVYSSFTGWSLRWPAAWFASKREYAHDLHVPCWRKADGPVEASLWDTSNTLVEWDDFVDGGMTSARFTSLRTYNKPPKAAFLARSLTRALDSSLLVDTHVVAVVNYAREIAQDAIEGLIGRVIKKNADGTATKESLAELSSLVNGIIQPALLSNKRGEGPKCSSVVWTPADDDLFNISDAVLNSTMALNILGTIVQVNLVTQVG